MRGWALYQQALKNPTKDNNKVVRDLFEQALNIDPNSSQALAGDAATYCTSMLSDGETPKPITTQKYSVRSNGPSSSIPIDHWLIQ